MALKILLAEDEEALSRVYKAALEHQGYEVDQAFNGQEAVDLAEQNAYQVMIMDIMMPIKTRNQGIKKNSLLWGQDACHYVDSYG
mgnify:CR=1 FL=1